jgi:hypothetical protein
MFHNAEYNNSYSSYRLPNIVRVIKYRRLRWAGHVTRMEEDRRAFNIFTVELAGKRPLGRLRRILKEYNRLSLKYK